MEIDTEGKMFLVKEFQAFARDLEAQGNPSAPIQHMVVLQFLCEVGGSSNLQGSPVMFLTPDRARELGQRLIREAKSATESSREPNSQKKRH
jgi:hypothetical protein